ncbi:MAG: 50S ribosomal protein L17 [bacterium]
MRHHNANRKFGRVTKVRTALMRSLAVALVEKGKIKTTEAKAKELRPYVEKIVTSGKKNTLASRRNIIDKVGSETVAKHIVDVIAPKYLDVKGGYTRIIKLGRRLKDASPMAYIEFV